MQINAHNRMAFIIAKKIPSFKNFFLHFIISIIINILLYDNYFLVTMIVTIFRFAINTNIIILIIFYYVKIIIFK